MAKTVVGLMDTPREAESVVRDLTSECGCDRADIGLMARGEQEMRGAGTDSGEGSEVGAGALKGAGTGAAVGGVLGLVAGAASLAIPGIGPIIAAGPIASALAGAGIGAVAGGAIGALAKVGVPEEEAHYYAEGVKRGGTLITLHARDERIADCAAGVMRRHGAIDIDERAEQWRGEGWSAQPSAAKEQVLPVAEEELAVGKRQVSRGNVRVYSHTIEQPVEERVQLREEHAEVTRRPVDRPVTGADDAFRERAVEVRETAEEPVVAKRGRVVEEVHVGKQATEREQAVRDTLRRTDVRVEKTAAPAYRGPERRKRKLSFSGADRRVAAR
jgi:uncharacterized protein (TIGR02271 family)